MVTLSLSSLPFGSTPILGKCLKKWKNICLKGSFLEYSHYFFQHSPIFLISLLQHLIVTKENCWVVGF